MTKMSLDVFDAAVRLHVRCARPSQGLMGQRFLRRNRHRQDLARATSRDHYLSLRSWEAFR